MKNYIPKTKFDVQAVQNLSVLPLETIRTDIPQLLEWMQDMNWPVGRGIAKYFTPHINEIKENLLDILKSNDDIWKYWIINSLIAYSEINIDQELISIIKRIANHPSRGEIEEGVDVAAKELISDFKW
jgi:hypothetical protein